MTIKNFITKGILPILLIGVITWLGRYIFMVNGSIDWFRFMLVYGVPIGIGIRAVWYVIAFPVSRLIRKGKSRI